MNANVIFQGGSMLQLFHKEMEGYLTAEGVFGGPVVESGKSL